ncbi:MAG: hypothetical protein DRP61_05675 [Candidatus Omnitrophota bacterium]|nr:MAG: hypothetical protein DRP61_05675 [Candidatus Omnitrophota bacterium]
MHNMRASRPPRSQVGKGMIIIASVLLLGLVVLSVGYFKVDHIAFYAGLLITLAGVLMGVQCLMMNDESGSTSR